MSYLMLGNKNKRPDPLHHHCSPPRVSSEKFPGWLWFKNGHPDGEMWICDDCFNVYVSRNEQWRSLAGGELEWRERRTAKKFRKTYIKMKKKGKLS